MKINNKIRNIIIDNIEKCLSSGNFKVIVEEKEDKEIAEVMHDIIIYHYK